MASPLPEAPNASRLSTTPNTATEALDLTDERIMEMIQGKDPDALGILHDRYARLIKATVMKILHNDAESDDLLQEVYVEIWNRAGGYDPGKGKALSWMVTIARRRAIDRLRSREAYSRMEERLQFETQKRCEDSFSHVAEDVEHSEMRRHLQRVMAGLPPAQRHVINLAYYGGLSQRDIAAKTGIPLGTIKTRLELGMKKLTVALQGFEDLL